MIIMLPLLALIRCHFITMVSIGTIGLTRGVGVWIGSALKLTADITLRQVERESEAVLFRVGIRQAESLRGQERYAMLRTMRPRPWRL